jgi:hypothetical protein
MSPFAEPRSTRPGLTQPGSTQPGSTRPGSTRPGEGRPGVVPTAPPGQTCEMLPRECGAAALLLTGGPVRVPFRPCCAAALVQGLGGAGGERAA